MSWFYEVSYRLGFHPWEDLAAHPPFADQLLSLVAREEHGVEPPYGRALDLGCGLRFRRKPPGWPRPSS